MNIAVVGGGVAGIGAAYILSQKHQVTLFEKNDYLGGHTNTVIIPDGPDAGTPVDTGFIVLNDRTYPLLHRFLDKLDVAVRYADMSFSYYCEASGFQYAGTTLNGLFAQRRNIFRPRFLTLLWEMKRFCQTAMRRLEEDSIGSLTLGEYLERDNYQPTLIEDYVVPMGAAIWSTTRGEMMDFPASTFLRFFANHGLLSLRDRPSWQTVVGGSHSYVLRFKECFQGKIEIAHPVVEISRESNGVRLRLNSGEERFFDKVVIATHADQALELLSDPSEEEKKLLGTWHYQKNHTVLHTDSSLLAPLRRAWASWNYVREINSSEQAPVSVSYHMNRLQGLKTAREYIVTLNSTREIPKEQVIAEFHYTHPTFTAEAVDSQSRLANLCAVRNTYFCGSYFGYGFHEDALRSAVEVGKLFGLEL